MSRVHTSVKLVGWEGIFETHIESSEFIHECFWVPIIFVFVS